MINTARTVANLLRTKTILSAVLAACLFVMRCARDFAALVDGVRYCRCGEAEMCSHFRARTGASEGGHADDFSVSAGVALPAERAGLFHRDAGRELGREHA